MQIPTVQLGKPEHIEDFDMEAVGQIEVYTGKQLKFKNDRIHIFLRKFLWVKELVVDGVAAHI